MDPRIVDKVSRFPSGPGVYLFRDAAEQALYVGKAADLIVVDGNPDQDLFALERVRMTFVGGKRMHG